MERIQKILAKAGIASRRKAEELIREGSVTVNGKVAQIGDQAEMGKDAIKVNGKLLQKLEAPVYLLFHKPKGVLSTMSDPEGRPTIAGYLMRFKVRLFPVGRLDYNSEGLLLLTNDGALTEELQKQSDLLRVYHAKVRGHLTKEEVDRLAAGGRLGPRHQNVKPFSVRLSKDLTKKSMLEIAFQGAGAVDLKAYLEAKGFLVERIIRTAIGHLVLGDLPPGQYRSLTESQVRALINQPELGLRRLKEGEREEQPFAEVEEDEEGAEKPRVIIRSASEDSGEGSERERPRRGDRGPRGGFGAQRFKRPGFRGRSEEGYGREPRERSGYSRGPKRFGSREEGSERAEGAPRFSRGDRPARGGFGDRPKRGGFGGKKFGEGKPRNEDFARRSFRRSRDDSPAPGGAFDRPRSSRPFGKKSPRFGSRDREFGAPGSEPRGPRGPRSSGGPGRPSRPRKPFSR